MTICGQIPSLLVDGLTGFEETMQSCFMGSDRDFDMIKASQNLNHNKIIADCISMLDFVAISNNR